ncbi:MAG: type VI secretion system contractile sheath small subunit [Rhodospirillaceae bacterium]
MASVHDKLERVRKPRVYIRFDVETEGAEPKNDLPFVVGVMGDYSGNDPGEALQPLRDRKFVQIDRDNFDTVLAKIAPGLKLKVDNTLANDGSQLPVNLQFRSMDDFEPGAVVNQVEPLRKMLEARNQLRDLLSKADNSQKLENILETILQDKDQIRALSEAIESRKAAEEGNK